MNQEIFYLFWWYKVLYCVILQHRVDGVIISEFTPYVTSIDFLNENQYGCWSTQDIKDDNIEDISHICCERACKSLNFDTFSKIRFLQTCIEIFNYKFSRDLVVFEDKTANLNGFNFNLLGVHMPPYLLVDESKPGINKFSGVDGFIIAIISKKMNFTLTYTENINRNKPNMDTWMKNLRDIAFRRRDFSANPIYVVNLVHLDFMYPVTSSGLCFVLHKSGATSPWRNLISTFEIRALIMLLIVFQMTCFIYYYYLLKSNDNKQYFNNLVRSYLFAL